MRILTDVNILLALVYDENEHHHHATQWLKSVVNDRIIVCRTTQSALLRLLTLSSLMQANVLTMGEAWGVYDRLMSDGRFVFASEPENLEDIWRALCPAKMIAPKKWMDAYLAAFAIAVGAQLVTLDRGFRDFPGLNLHLLGPTAIHEDAAAYQVE